MVRQIGENARITKHLDHIFRNSIKLRLRIMHTHTLMGYCQNTALNQGLFFVWKLAFIYNEWNESFVVDCRANLPECFLCNYWILNRLIFCKNNIFLQRTSQQYDQATVLALCVYCQKREATVHKTGYTINTIHRTSSKIMTTKCNSRSECVEKWDVWHGERQTG